MSLIRLSTITVLFLGIISPLPADSLIVVGAGTLGPYRSTISLANPSAAPLSCALSTLPDEPTPCLPVCPIQNIDLPPDGSAQFPLDFSASTGFPVNTILVTPAEGLPLPTIKVHIVNTDVPTEGVDLPAIRFYRPSPPSTRAYWSSPTSRAPIRPQQPHSRRDRRQRQ
jgi:hypothetical protein